MATTIDDVAELARVLEQAKKSVEDAEAVLKAAQEFKRRLAEETIPAVMQELGIKDLTLENGKKMKLKQDVYAQIESGNKPICWEWLNDNGFGGLIKVKVTAEFGKGQREQAVALCDELSSDGYYVAFNEDVHAQTLKAFLKEQIAKGNSELPLDLFGARPVWVADIK